MQSRVEREILGRMEKDIGTLNISVKAAGFVNSGFAIVTAALAVKSAKEAENFYGELSRQIFNITVGEFILQRLARVLPALLRRIGVNISVAGPPLPHKIAFGLLMIAGSFLVGWAIDEATDKSGIFEDLFREGGGNNHVKRRREERQKKYQK